MRKHIIHFYFLCFAFCFEEEAGFERLPFYHIRQVPDLSLNAGNLKLPESEKREVLHHTSLSKPAPQSATGSLTALGILRENNKDS